jgi:hypothetical protein
MDALQRIVSAPTTVHHKLASSVVNKLSSWNAETRAEVFLVERNHLFSFETMPPCLPCAQEASVLLRMEHGGVGVISI